MQNSKSFKVCWLAMVAAIAPAICALSVGEIPLSLQKDIVCQSKELNYWNAIILDTFHITSPSTASIDGPIFVGRNMTVDSYAINRNNIAQCSSKDYDNHVPIHEYGLYMNLTEGLQSYQLRNITVSGSVGLHGHNTPQHHNILDSIIRLNPSCRLLVNSPAQTKEFVYNYEKIVKTASLYLSLQPPTHVLQKDGSIRSMQEHMDDSHYYFNFAPCHTESTCLVPEGSTLSDPTAFLLGKSEWKGADWPSENKTIVFNVPVFKDSTFDLANQWSIMDGLRACSTIWNFFSVDKDGMIDDSAYHSFALNRTTQQLVGGTVLAPFAQVHDSATGGGFAGQLVAANYTSEGVSIHDFSVLDQSCKPTKAACWPQSDLEDTISQEKETYLAADADNKMLDNDVASVVESSLLNEAPSLQRRNVLDMDVITCTTEDATATLPFHPAYHLQLKDKKTTETIYIKTLTRTKLEMQVEYTEVTYTTPDVHYVTTIMIEPTSTSISLVIIPLPVEAKPTGVKFDLLADRIETLY